ncbi:MoaD/ThiS family protein [Maribacter sp. 2307UL18-2]|uniref:MoaD/ThiS family protein n=1 Tax=Maribacter sp. 2307UL18-2 TaxID=3386274 RepID=UPI0039BD2E8E
MEILLFGIAKDIVGQSEIRISSDDDAFHSVQELKEFMVRKFPEFGKLSSFAVAVNSEYAQDDVPLNRNDEIAIIPPVSGG